MLNNQAKQMLDWTFIQNHLIEKAISEEAKMRMHTLEMHSDIHLVNNALEETTEARRLLDIQSSVPLHGLEGVKAVLDKLKREEVLRPMDFWTIAGFVKDAARMKRYMDGKSEAAPKISAYALSIKPLEAIYESIVNAIYHHVVIDEASNTLSRIRKQIGRLEGEIKSKLQNYISASAYEGVLSEALIAQRNGRYVIPVKSMHKKTIGGHIHDRSRSGGTLFIEPEAVRKLQNDLDALKIDEENEVYCILANLSNEVASEWHALYTNYECLVTYDFIFAKGKLSKQMNAIRPEINTLGALIIVNGRHPMLGKNAIPLNVSLSTTQRHLIITGPNTGGKTVTMKTIGLFGMMMQCGLHVPSEAGTSLPLYSQILCDIGDGQSVEQNLSTFSSHITNINAILKAADKRALVILDEIGSGTDPSEGMGIGIAVLEALDQKGAQILASTHYNEIKIFASENKAFINGSMGFDILSLSPLYVLTLGEAGESSALHIAYRLGMDKAIVDRAYALANREHKTFEPTSLLQPDGTQVVLAGHKTPRSEYAPKAPPKFQVGDNVWIHTMKRSGIIAESHNAKGEYAVLVMGKKIRVNHKRLSLYINGEALYPDDYDMDIALKSKTHRKSEKAIRKGKKNVILDH